MGKGGINVNIATTAYVSDGGGYYHTGSTALHIAAERGFTAIGQALITAGATRNAKDSSIGYTPLIRAAYYGRRAIVELLLRYNVPIDDKSNGDSTALHQAMEGGHVEVGRLLVRAGADINARDGVGDTPLHDAARCRKLESVQFLIKEKAYLSVKSNSGQTPLCMARTYGCSNIVDLLKSYGVSDKDCECSSCSGCIIC